MVQTLETRKVLSGEVLYSEGTYGKQEMYIIKEGKVELSISRGGRKIVLATLTRNQSFGEMELLSCDPRYATATALSYCELQVVNVRLLKRQAEETPALIRNLLRTLIASLKNNNEIVARQAHTQPVIPVYAQLLELMAAGERHVRGPRNERRAEVTLPVARVLEKIRQICGHSGDQALATLKQMARLNLLCIESGGGTRQSRRAGGKMIVVESDKHSYQDLRFNFEDIVARARQVPEEVSHEVMAHVQSEQDHIDLEEFAELVAVNRDVLLRKLARDEIADEIFVLRKSVALRFVTEKGKEYFSRRRRLAANQIQSVADLECISQSLLGDALHGLELHEVAKLVPVISDKAILDRLFSAMGKARREEVEDLLTELRPDPVEGYEIEDKLIQIIHHLAARQVSMA